MTPEETIELRHLIIHAVKELGEIAECIVKDDGRPDHWKNELGDLCGLAISPMLELAGIEYADACATGTRRKRQKTVDKLALEAEKDTITSGNTILNTEIVVDGETLPLRLTFL